MKTAFVLSFLTLSLSQNSFAAAVRSETADELAIKKVVQQLAKSDLKFVTARTEKVCGSNEKGTLVVVKTQIKPGVLQTVKVYGVTDKGVLWGGSEVHDCSVEK